MKRVIRRGVFETNSSSSHSLTLKRIKGTPKNEIDEDASFEIRSPLAKTIQMLGLIQNAESDYEGTAMSIDELDEAGAIKHQIITELKEKYPDAVMPKTGTEISTLELSNLITPIITDIEFNGNKFFGKFQDQILTCFFTVDSMARHVVRKFKKEMLNELAKINNWTLDDAKREVEFEAFANTEIRDALADKKNTLDRLRKIGEQDYSFREAFRASGITDIIAFAQDYLITDCQSFKKRVNGKISCERYFSNGCLNYCDCGFESYYSILDKLDLDSFAPDEEIRQAAQRFLSNEYKLVAVEKYCGFIFEKTGEIF